MNNRILPVFLFFIFAFSPAAFGASKEDKVLNAIQKRYEQTRTFKANFVQNAYIKMLDEIQTTKGKVYIKKPGRMRWEYKSPDPQILVSDNKVLWLYVPEDQQVNKMPIESVYSNNTPALFLAGKGKLGESFEVVQIMDEDRWLKVVLQPKDKDFNIVELTLLANKKNFQIVGSSVYDNLGNKTEIYFNDIKENLKLSKKLFKFKVPKGVELLDFSESSSP